MPVTQDEFRAALSRFASGVTVVTTKDAAGNLFGITVSAFCSVSLEPPLVLVCIEKTTGSHNALLESGLFVVNVLNEEQMPVSEQFASPSANRFQDVDISLNIDGLPILSAAIATLECSLKRSHDGGDHSIFVGEVINCSTSDGDPLVYFRGDYWQLADRSRGQD